MSSGWYRLGAIQQGTRCLKLPRAASLVVEVDFGQGDTFDDDSSCKNVDDKTWVDEPVDCKERRPRFERC